MDYTNLLTIAMPVYERKDYFLEALESAINQTVKCEIIVVDNCSSHDYFKNICEEKGITYYRNETNIGMNPNFNRCFELAGTEYVMTLQDDDILAPNYVESFLKAHTKHPDIDVFFTDFVRNTPNGKLPHRHVLPFGYMKNGQKVIEYAVKYKLGFPYLNSSIKREKFTGFYTAYSGSNDWVWIYDNADKFVFYGDSRVLYQFRQHDQQDTKNNMLRYRFTLPYIYDAILKEKANDPEIKRKASLNAFWALIQLKSVAGRKIVNDFIKEENIFSIYLKEKLNSDRLIRTIFYMPSNFVYLVYRSLRKVGLTG
ncbi:glycosyltransferase family 2 protein [Mariniphaga sediminis]|uniref:Glycosyltransferase family 2 protein n=1 Tax=Mariniphaga sediminis TaxID=1628158 RepID=A0A399D4V8_9BACT|nr:glycosyltransferase family 2 protein [Mariniphaga sediminis]RIH65702.1 glycosyltransferase family 2 protein [Mariniphaga sediminis]